MLSSVFLLLSFASSTNIATAPPLVRPASVLTCKAVTRAQIEAAVGRHVDVLTPEESACSFSAGDVSVTVAVTELTAEFDLAAEVKNLQAAFPGSSLRELPAFTWRAFALDIPGAGTQLHIVSPDREYLLVSVLGLASGQNGFDAAAQIARSLTQAPQALLRR